MSFSVGLSGLNAASADLDVIGNNIANAETVGFKGSRTQFADVFAVSLSGAGANNVGIGVKIATVAQQFTQGNISATSNPLDVAINGRGFFRMDQNGVITYTRNGQFHFDAQGNFVNDQGLKLTGYPVDANGIVVPSSPAPIQVSFADIAPRSTSQFGVGMNFDANASVPTNAVFDPTDPTSYNFSTAGSIFDSLGNSHALVLYTIKTAVAGQWQMYGQVDGGALANVDLGAGAGLPITFNFNSSGQLTTAMPTNASVTLANGATTPLAFTFDLTGSTQYGSVFGVNNIVQDGYASGHLAGMSVGEQGVVEGRYTNGQTRNLAQVVLADFRNPQGLKPLGDNQWEEAPDSGLPLVGAPGSGLLGLTKSSALEDSGVDLTAQLVDLITAQRMYQANAQTIKTQDQVLQTLVNLR